MSKKIKIIDKFLNKEPMRTPMEDNVLMMCRFQPDFNS